MSKVTIDNDQLEQAIEAAINAAIAPLLGVAPDGAEVRLRSA